MMRHTAAQRQHLLSRAASSVRSVLLLTPVSVMWGSLDTKLVLRAAEKLGSVPK
jgi:hypothetical protein